MTKHQFLWIIVCVSVFSLAGGIGARLVEFQPDGMVRVGGLLSGRTEYEAFPLSDGLARINRRTGDVSIIRDHEVVKFTGDSLSRSSTIVSDGAPPFKSLRSSEEYLPETDELLWSQIEYKPIGNELKYRYTVGPYLQELDDPLENTPSTLTFDFVDADGFAIRTSDMKLSALTRVSGAKGIVHWSYEGEVNITPEDFLLIAGTNEGWSFDDDFRKALAVAKPAAAKFRDEQLAQIQNLIDEKYVQAIIALSQVWRTPFGAFMTPIHPSKWANLIQLGEITKMGKEFNLIAPPVSEATDQPPDKSISNASKP